MTFITAFTSDCPPRKMRMPSSGTDSTVTSPLSPLMISEMARLAVGPDGRARLRSGRLIGGRAGRRCSAPAASGPALCDEAVELRSQILRDGTRVGVGRNELQRQTGPVDVRVEPLAQLDGRVQPPRRRLNHEAIVFGVEADGERGRQTHLRRVSPGPLVGFGNFQHAEARQTFQSRCSSSVRPLRAP